MIEDAPISGKDWRPAFEGYSYRAITPTAGTGIIGHAAPTTFDEAKPYIVIFNGNDAKSGINIYPQQLRLFTTVISAGGTGSNYTHTIDNGNRRSGNGTALIVANTNMGCARASAAIITVGAVTGTAATTARRLLGNYTPRLGVIEVVGDEIVFVWGAVDSSVASTATNAGTAQLCSNFRLPPVAIAPQTSYTIVEWKGSQSTGPTLEVAFDYLER